MEKDRYCLIVRESNKEKLGSLEKMLPLNDCEKNNLEKIYYFGKNLSEREILKITKVLCYLKFDYWRFEKLV